MVRENDPAPWVDALRELLHDRAAYERESQTSREVALRFVAGLDAGQLERLSEGAAAAELPVAPAQATIESLSPEKRALLLERLRKRKLPVMPRPG